MANWYELDEPGRVKEFYSKYSILDFWNWWDNDSKSWMEVRIKDFEVVKETASKLMLPFSASGVYVRESQDLKNVIATVREKATIWFGINPRKANWNKWGKKQLGGGLVNIQSVNFLFIDVDRIVKKSPANNEELKNANELADKILARLGQEGWNKDYCKICSGNGVQLLIRLDYPIKMPVVEFSIDKKEYKANEEFDNFTNIFRGKIGKQLVIFSNRYTKELGVNLDKA